MLPPENLTSSLQQGLVGGGLNDGKHRRPSMCMYGPIASLPKSHHSELKVPMGGAKCKEGTVRGADVMSADQRTFPTYFLRE
ncbi:hypothetical protein LEMLEM_LOCUS27273 [Lemmus lemmus]